MRADERTNDEISRSDTVLPTKGFSVGEVKIVTTVASTVNAQTDLGKATTAVSMSTVVGQPGTVSMRHR